MKVNVGTLCSGYDSQCMALDELKKMHPDFDYELVFWSEIEKDAIRVHNALYPQWADRNEGDMTKIDWDKFKDVDLDLLTYSTPCTDISNAGKQAGLKDGSGTRSSIIWHVEKCIKSLKPKFLMLENVKALAQSKFVGDLSRWIDILDSYGYTSYYKVLNATDFNVPQNRERIFVISIRKDLNFGNYRFPDPVPLTKSVDDCLEDEDDVPEKLYLSDEQVDRFIKNIYANFGDSKESEHHAEEM